MELMAQSDDNVKPAIQTFLEILGELAVFASRVSDPRLRLLALRLGLFPMSKDDLKKALEAEMSRVKEMEEKRKAKEQGDGQSSQSEHG